MSRHRSRTVAALILLFAAPLPAADPLPGTRPLTVEGDLAARMVDGIHKYLDRELVASVEKRRQFWKPDYSSADAYTKSVRPNRERLARILGVVDARLPVRALQCVATTEQDSLVAKTDSYRVHAVRWPVLDGVDAEGLLLEPKGKPIAGVVAVPDADETPEMLVGLAPGVAQEHQFARRLAENGCRVLVPTLIDRRDTWSGNSTVGMTNQTHREFLYRMAYQQGRHIIGYEVQKILAAVDWFEKLRSHPAVPLSSASYNELLRMRERSENVPSAVWGHGEGGLLALCSAAIDPRISVTVVSGHFGSREATWEEPIYRNVWGLLREFGDAEMAALIVPHVLIVDARDGPLVDGPPPAKDTRFAAAAPGRLSVRSNKEIAAEAARARRMVQELKLEGPLPSDGRIITSLEADAPGPDTPLGSLLRMFVRLPKLTPPSEPPRDARKNFDPAPRQRRQFQQLVDYTQLLVRKSEQRRQEFFWSKLDTSSPEKYQQSAQSVRDFYWEEVVGKLPKSEMPLNPRSRLAYDQPKWKGYDVLLDVYPDVFASGVLLVPQDLKPGEKRPVVVCQHGLEGTPKDVVDPKMKSVYNAFGAQLADRGYIVYAPQNPYRGGNHFRQINRKANPLKLTMFSFIVRQHERTLDWLASLPFVDPERIAFYGLSYGGETAVRAPPLVTRYALSICSADFNHFPWKTTTLEFGASYMLVNTYEIFDYNMNNTFSHAEMAALIAPRPFMVERGHDDGVGLDEWVAYEYAKVRRLYAKLRIPERTAIEFFDGGHAIHEKGTIAFLEKHLNWPLP